MTDLRVLFSALTPVQRAIAAFRYIDGVVPDKIALALGISRSEYDSIWDAARTRLASAVAELGGV